MKKIPKETILDLQLYDYGDYGVMIDKENWDKLLAFLGSGGDKVEMRTPGKSRKKKRNPKK